jgi:hypothetical protein
MMAINCKYCSRRFKTQAALNWHLQKDKDCISKRNKTKPKTQQKMRTTMQMPPNMQIPPAGLISSYQLPQQSQPSQPPHQLQPTQQLPPQQSQPPQQLPRHSNLVLSGSVQTQTNVSVSVPTKKSTPPPVPPKHGRASSKTEIDFSKMFLAEPQSEVSNQFIDQSVNQSADSNLIDDLHKQIAALKETNSKLLQDKLSHANEIDQLKQKIISQDAELHNWKDKLLTKKQKMSGENLKNELITLILESDLNIEAIPDEVESEIYGFIIDKLADNQSLIKKIFCCK